MADLLHQLGYLEQGQLVHAMRDDLVGEYIGQTAPKTRRLLDRAMGGVLFIDEASALYQPDNGKDFGLEAIEILLQVMENERDKFVVILAGYLRAIRHRPPSRQNPPRPDVLTRDQGQQATRRPRALAAGRRGQPGHPAPPARHSPGH